jgi:hypothetical protein
VVSATDPYGRNLGSLDRSPFPFGRKCSRLDLKLFLRCFFPRLIIATDAVSSMPVIRLSQIR